MKKKSLNLQIIQLCQSASSKCQVNVGLRMKTYDGTLLSNLQCLSFSCKSVKRAEDWAHHGSGLLNPKP